MFQAYTHTHTHTHTHNYTNTIKFLGFSGSSAGKEFACNAGDPSFDSWVRKIPWSRDRLPTPVFLGFPGGSDMGCNVGDLGWILRLGRSPGGGHSDPL